MVNRMKKPGKALVFMADSDMEQPERPKGNRRRTLAASVRAKLLDQINAGKYVPGDKLPSEARLTEEFSVSRTVIREAIASLRADGLVESRQGSGVYILASERASLLPFQEVDPSRISSMLEILEIRTAVECESAALAAARRSPAQEGKIIDAFHDFCSAAEAGEKTTNADFALHMAIAEAANNARFPEFLSLIGPESIPRRTLENDHTEAEQAEYVNMLCTQHEAIVNAILEGNEDDARAAMRDHLRSSQARYRTLLRRKS
ncbi:transcriptional regulator, GntR family [Aliiruegeria lutimaris]|uniref:Transcriptional regulator, GntR family n=2 Tax=Aliiruegeria lutimaris TaxID=571298 RepID=A0A1G8RHG1_9RHOB|nr:transcriptional regulator, GntR family [Aliiruegeria lutimaris]